MKFTLEYSKEEYTSLIEMVNKMTDTVAKALDHRHEERMARLQTQRLKTVGSMFGDLDDDIDEDVEEAILNIVKGGKEEEGPFGDPKSAEPSSFGDDSNQEMSEYALRGQIAFNNLVKLWMIGFNIEGADQPPRAEKCKELVMSFEGRAIIHYLEHLRLKYPEGGLTYAVRDSNLVPDEEVRLLAENMTAVSSACRFTQLAHYLEHPDPSQLEDFFNV